MAEPESVRRRRLDADRLNRDVYGTYVGARISHDQRRALERAADEADDSVSEIIRKAIQSHIKSLRRANRVRGNARKTD